MYNGEREKDNRKREKESKRKIERKSVCTGEERVRRRGERETQG